MGKHERKDFIDFRVFLKVFTERLEELPDVSFKDLLTQYVVAHHVADALPDKSDEERLLASSKIFDAFNSIK